MTTQVVERITQFRMETHDTFPYLSPYVYSLDPVETDRVETMAVDKYGRLYWNPEWCDSIGLKQGAYTVLHEAWHLIARHCHRSESIIGLRPTEQERYDLNIAYDIIVWEMLEAISDWCPEGGVTLPDAMKQWPGITRNMLPEQLYAIISEARANKEREQGPAGQPSSTEKDEEGDGQGDSSPKNEGEDSDGSGKPESPSSDQSQDGKGSGQGDQDGPTGGGKGQGDEAVDTYGFKPIGGGSASDGQERDYELAPDPKWEAFKEDNLLQSVENKIAELESDRNWTSGRGSIPTFLKRLIKQKLRPQPNPWDSLRATVAKYAANPKGSPDYTYSRPNRRQSAIPGAPRLKGLKKYSPKACVVIDTSGSMTSACLAKALSVCKQGFQAIGGFPVITCDAKVQQDKVLSSFSEDFEFVGGGGTDMTIPIAHAEEKYRPDVIVLVTDGDTPWPNERTRAHLVVALTQENSTPDWAITVRIPDDPRKESFDD